MVAPDRALSMGQIEQTICTNKWLMLNCDSYIAILKTFNSVQKRSLSNVWTLSKKCVNKSCTHLIYLHKEAFALNNIQWLICHKTKQNQINIVYNSDSKQSLTMDLTRFLPLWPGEVLLL